MFENILYQSVKKQLIKEIKSNSLPQSLLFYGPERTGKLTTALEVARVLSCKEGGEWNCPCPSCQKHKVLLDNQTAILGYKDCVLQLKAAAFSFKNALINNTPYIFSLRSLFLKMLRILLLRFTPSVMEEDANLLKVSSLTLQIDEYVEEIDTPSPLPPYEKVEKICDDIVTLSTELQEKYLSRNVSITQIRSLSSYLHTTATDGVRVIIIENADNLIASSRNALLKILEEPPKDCLFILLTTRKECIIQTLLSRLRLYRFESRTAEEESKIIERVFHEEVNLTLSSYIMKYLPVPLSTIQEQASVFVNSIYTLKIPNLESIIKACFGLNLLDTQRVFFTSLIDLTKKLNTPAGLLAQGLLISYINTAFNNISSYNQSILSALETLVTKYFFVYKTYNLTINDVE